MADSPQNLRVALLAGSLVQGGAEKQLVYMARALQQANVEIRIYSLTQGEPYESVLESIGLSPTWIGRFNNPLSRVLALAGAIRKFRPHFLQSTHFFSNLYVSIVARLCGIVAIGTLRNDTFFEVNANGRWGKWLLRMPSALIANSMAARRNAETFGIRAEKIRILANVIDLADFDVQITGTKLEKVGVDQPLVVAVGRLVHEKRLDRFVTALALARREISVLKGIIIGDGPEKLNLELMAKTLDLLPHGLQFLGRRCDVPALLSQTDMFLHTSDHEGFPNVLLEAMAARLPIITTPAGDASVVVQDGVTGYMVPFDDVEGMAERMVHLAKSAQLRRQLGEAGRRRVEQHYSFDGLADGLLSIYRHIAVEQNDRHVLNFLPA
ncbi:MAG: glycosyltransferase [Anaerolineae bacterium]|nr:glycosyltransferase [Anaerolineae bacterium]